MTSAIEQMQETRQLIVQNFHIFHDFFDLFNGAFSIFVLPNEQVDIVKVQQLKLNYRMFIYERPYPHLRGLPPLDDNGNSAPLVDSDYSDCSSADDTQNALQRIMINIRPKNKDDIIS